MPAVEFGPVGGGHHGPEEWVSVSSLARYRQALGDFVRGLPALARARQPICGRSRAAWREPASTRAERSVLVGVRRRRGC